jgi:hypothetical protein
VGTKSKWGRDVSRAESMGTKKEKGAPPADYVCAACKQGGHWVFDCSQVLFVDAWRLHLNPKP